MAGFIDMLGKKDLSATMEQAMLLAAETLKTLGMEDHPVVRGVMDGLTPAQAMGLTRDQLDVIYTLAYRKLMAGELTAAEQAFSYLMMVDPLHGPNIYMAGVVQIAQGNPARAEEIFLMFLALDATNPKGYLRLGDCWLAQGMRDKAAEAYRLALAECANGHGDAETAEEARQRMALVKQEVRG